MPLSSSMILVFLIFSTITVIAMMRVLTNIVEHETDLHDLRVQIQEVQYERELRDAQLRGLIPASVPETHDPIEAVEQTQIAADNVAAAIENEASAPAQAA